MNAPETIAPLFDADLLARARAAAAATQRHIVAELETLTGVEPRQLLQALAQLLDMRVIETADMLALKPAFDRVPLSRAMQRRCVLLRDADASFVGVVTSPFDLDLQTWLAAQANAAIDIRLALPSDLQAYHARMEEST